MNKKRIIKSIILPDELESGKSWYPRGEHRFNCDDCGSLIFYLQKIMAVVQETSEYQIYTYKDKTYYSLREAGFNIYCAECGSFKEIYFYDNNNIVCEFDDLEYAEVEEVEYCLAQYNQKKSYIPRYVTGTTNILLKKIKEYEQSKKKRR